ncbi:MAG: glycosyltransferase family 2 protein [Chitinophagales bacterium]|nr:glycosyltransferase [Chitinophagales bacterium]MDW8392783.1 glycosyltransferase family 2 protein [Chitinophagales bacterium]
MNWLAWSGMAFAVVRAAVSLLNVLKPSVLRRVSAQAVPVSVLIPARNEARRIGVLLQALSEMQQEYREVLVLDDQSDDHTAEVVSAFSSQNPGLRLIHGEALPEGWNGKNWACHQLAQLAAGSYLLFLDADVQVFPGFIGALVAELERSKSAMVSVFPRQEMKSVGEQIAIPLMLEVLLSLLPLFLVRKMRAPSLAAANGQCMLFRKEAYTAYLWHQRLRQAIAEDIAIARHMKRAGLPVSVYLSDRISCRMYEDYGQAVSGFAKNITAMTGNDLLAMGYGLLMTVAPVFMGLLPVGAALLWVLLEVCAVMLQCHLAAMNSGRQLLLLPLRRLTLLWVVMLALWKRYFSAHQWKGRRLT